MRDDIQLNTGTWRSDAERPEPIGTGMRGVFRHRGAAVPDSEEPLTKRRRVRNLILLNIAVYSIAAYAVLYTVRDLTNVELPVPLPPRVSTIADAIRGDEGQWSGKPSVDDLPKPEDYLPAETPPAPSLPPLPQDSEEVDAESVAILKQDVEAVGLYIAAAIESNAAELEGEGTIDVPARIESIMRSAPSTSSDLSVRLTRNAGTVEACVRGTRADAGEWFYLYPPGVLIGTRDATKCPQ